jgi:hypothetical protein
MGYFWGTALIAATFASAAHAAPNGFRPPATPLVTHDPYLSCWSMADRLYDEWPKHWTGKVNAMCGLIRVDGRTLRFMGASMGVSETVEQKSLEVRPTQTVYQFAAGPVDLTVTFTSPLLTDDLDILTRPATYVTFAVRANDGKPHEVQIYFDTTAEWAVHEPGQKVLWARPEVPGLDVMRIGTLDQKILQRVGDDVRIDWGYLLIAAPKAEDTATAIGEADKLRGSFARKGGIPKKDDKVMPRPANDRWPVLAVKLDLKSVGAEAVNRHLIVAYDDLYGIEYVGQQLRAWWRRSADMTAERMLQQAEKDYAPLVQRCDALDRALNDEATQAFGPKYAQICALAYRQAIAGCKIVAGSDGAPLMFPKECFSNGCIGTVDVIYPASPFFLFFSPDLLKAQLRPVFAFARSDAWKFPFAPHDLGTYPKANGQVYGNNKLESQMPVEECGNMLIMTAAICHCEEEQSAQFAVPYADTLRQWAEYLAENGLDPANQLCTDDFAGHLARNANLSMKAIVGLRGYALICKLMGDTQQAEKYERMSRDYAAKWIELARDGDHFVLAFGKPGTWSQKYNLVWDKVLGLDLFPKEVARQEVVYYKQVQKRYGVPLDNRKDYTKLDWLVWSATLADSPADFEALLAPAYDFLVETPTRVPMTDWYDTVTGKKIGFQARPVIGGVFIKLLTPKP